MAGAPFAGAAAAGAAAAGAAAPAAAGVVDSSFPSHFSSIGKPVCFQLASMLMYKSHYHIKAYIMPGMRILVPGISQSCYQKFEH